MRCWPDQSGRNLTKQGEGHEQGHGLRRFPRVGEVKRRDFPRRSCSQTSLRSQTWLSADLPASSSLSPCALRSWIAASRLARSHSHLVTFGFGVALRRPKSAARSAIFAGCSRLIRPAGKEEQQQQVCSRRCSRTFVDGLATGRSSPRAGSSAASPVVQ